MKLTLIFILIFKVAISQNFKEMKINGNIVHCGVLPFGQGILGDRMIFTPPESIPNANGKYITYFKEDLSTVAWEGFYKNSKRDSTWIEYWPEGQVFATYSFFNGKLHGKIIRKLKNGADWHIQFYKNGLADSTWIWYDPNLSNTPKRIEHYKNGLKNGEVLIYENGILSTKLNMSNDKLIKNDTVFFYYPDGKKLSSFFNRNDSLIMINHWDKYGKQTITNGTGAYHGIPDMYGKYEIGKYKNGLRDGDWQLFKSPGKLIRTSTYKNGKRTSPDPVEYGN